MARAALIVAVTTLLSACAAAHRSPEPIQAAACPNATPSAPTASASVSASAAKRLKSREEIGRALSDAYDTRRGTSDIATRLAAFERVLEDLRAIEHREKDPLVAGVETYERVSLAPGGAQAIVERGEGGLLVDAAGEARAWRLGKDFTWLEVDVLLSRDPSRTDGFRVREAMSDRSLVEWMGNWDFEPPVAVDAAHRLYFLPRQPDDEDDVVHVFDLASRDRLPFFEIARKAPAEPNRAAARLARLELSADGKTLVGSGGLGSAETVIWDVASRRRVQWISGGAGSLYYARPYAFDPTGRWIGATKQLAGAKDEGPIDAVAIVDRTRGTILGLASGCPTTTLAFSSDGKLLVTGGFLRACVHEVPSGKLLRKTEAVRSYAGPGDDLQNLDAHFFGPRYVHLATAEGTGVVFDATTGKRVWPSGIAGGGGALLFAGPGGLAVVAGGSPEEFVELDPTLKETRRPLRAGEQIDKPATFPELAPMFTDVIAAERLRAKLFHTVCSLGPFTFPREVCLAHGVAMD
jgi:hypothetical protein